MVPPHVEPHAASPLPQRVLAAGADGPQQRVRSGEMDVHAHAQSAFLTAVCFAVVAPFNQALFP